jgi:hypothetical protein
MPLHSYIMQQDLLHLQATWRTMPEYEHYFGIIASMPEATEVEKEIKVVLDKRFPKKCFETVLNNGNKRTYNWHLEAMSCLRSTWQIGFWVNPTTHQICHTSLWHMTQQLS